MSCSSLSVLVRAAECAFISCTWSLFLFGLCQSADSYRCAIVPLVGFIVPASQRPGVLLHLVSRSAGAPPRWVKSPSGWKPVMSVLKSVRSTTFLASLSVLVVVAGTLFGANIASADSIQVQGYQRASQTEACVAQVGETPWQASWGPDATWKPGWEQWANKGAGGWVCTRSITWAKTPVPASSSSGGGGSVSYRVGDIGPGGGLVFYIDGSSGLRYEMAPKTWGVNETTPIAWCSDTGHSVATNTAVGTGGANTSAMLTNASPFVACTSTAANAVRAYAGGGLTDWFLPSKDELNAMCNYSRSPSSPALPSVGCSGAQNGTFAGGAYGFVSDYYWSSSQSNAYYSWGQSLGDGGQVVGPKYYSLRFRPVRAF